MRTAWQQSSLAAACALLAACGGPPDTRPNLILITLDTFRDDRLGELTPHLTTLAGEAARFTNAVTPIGTTHPAHASLFTGLYPGGHGVRFNGDSLADSQTTLAERLGESGYETAGFISKRSMFVRGGLEQGFRTRSDEPGDWTDLESRIRSGDEVNRLVDQFLVNRKEPSDRPVFLWTHYFDAHSPYRRTPHAERRLKNYAGPLAQGASTELFYAYGSEQVPATADNRDALHALYDGEVAEVDRQVGALLELLRRHRVLENAVVIVVGDHGQLLGEHAQVGHGGKLWEPVLRVPLLIWESDRREARNIEPRVSLVDLLPTVLELVGLPGNEARPGRSLAPGMQGRRLPEVRHFASVRMPKLADRPGEGALGATGAAAERRTVAVYLGSHKLILDVDSVLLFDLKFDALEERDLSNNEALRLTLERLRPLALLHQARERPGADPLDLPDDVLDELRQFGYLD